MPEPERAVPPQPLPDGIYDSGGYGAWNQNDYFLCDGRYNTFYLAMMRGVFGEDWHRGRFMGEATPNALRDLVERDVSNLTDTLRTGMTEVSKGCRSILFRWKGGKRHGEIEAVVRTR